MQTPTNEPSPEDAPQPEFIAYSEDELNDLDPSELDGRFRKFGK